MKDSTFQFKGFNIKRSLIEKKEGEPSTKLSLGFTPKGFINKKDSCFQLYLSVKIEDENKVFNIEIEAIADFIFDSKIEAKQLDNFFYINAPALLFPYIRAYISTLTTLSGLKPLTLPTLNLSKLGKELAEKTTEVQDC